LTLARTTLNTRVFLCAFTTIALRLCPQSVVKFWCGTGRLESRSQKLQVSSLAETRRFTNNSLSQPCDQKFSTCSFLDRSSILFPYRTSGQERTLRFQVATFGLTNSADETALRVYDFELDVLGPQPEQTYFLSMNTLPSNTSNSHFPGFFHSEPSSRLLALEIETPVTDFILGGNIPLHVLYVPHDVLLGYIMAHPSDADTVVVPWEEWGHGNAHILTLPEPSPDRFLGSKIVCGMHAMTEPPMVMVQGDQKILRIMDYHPRRIAHNPVTQVTPLRLGDALDSPDSHDTAAWQKADVSTDENIPYAFKDIPLPPGLRLENIKCVLGEDVVALFEVGPKNHSTERYEDTHTDQVFHGYFQRFWSQDREGVLSPPIAPRDDRRRSSCIACIRAGNNVFNRTQDTATRTRCHIG
jgi:hypothetical protein